MLLAPAARAHLLAHLRHASCPRRGGGGDVAGAARCWGCAAGSAVCASSSGEEGCAVAQVRGRAASLASVPLLLLQRGQGTRPPPALPVLLSPHMRRRRRAQRPARRERGGRQHCAPPPPHSQGGGGARRPGGHHTCHSPVAPSGITIIASTGPCTGTTHSCRRSAPERPMCAAAPDHQHSPQAPTAGRLLKGLLTLRVRSRRQCRRSHAAPRAMQQGLTCP